jgi:hypothetical protein
VSPTRSAASSRWSDADRATLEQTATALRARGFLAEVADSAARACELVLEAIPEGAEVHVALSETLRELGLTAEIDESGRYDSVRARLNQLDRVTQRPERQKTGAAPKYVLGSAHAITSDGQIVVGSGSGSQLGAHAYSAGQVILVVGHQKLVRDLDEGLRRLREYSLPRDISSDASRRLPLEVPVRPFSSLYAASGSAPAISTRRSTFAQRLD